MTMKLRPLHDLVVIDPIDSKESHGGIYIPDVLRDDTANKNDYIRESNQWCRGSVVAAGPGVYAKRESEVPGIFEFDGRRDPVDLEPGDIVYYKRAEATPVPDSEQVIVHEASVAFEIQESA